MYITRHIVVSLLLVVFALGNIGGCSQSSGGNGDIENGEGDGDGDRSPVLFESIFSSLSGGMALDSMNNIYIADNINHRVQVFDSAGNFLFMFGWGVDDGTDEFQVCTTEDTPCQAGLEGGGAGQLHFPNDLAVDSMNNIYVSDPTNHRVQVFDSAGNFLFMFGWRVDDDTDEFQICTSESAPCQAGSVGGGAGQFDGSAGITLDNSNNIYVSDFPNHRVQVFDSAGNFLFMFGWGVDDGTDEFQVCTTEDTPCQAGLEGGGAGQFNLPFGIAVDSIKNIYVVDSFNNRTQVFDSEGSFLFMFGSFGDGPGEFFDPDDIAVDGMNNLYVTDTRRHRIQVFDSSANFLFMFGWGVDDGTNEFQVCTTEDTPCQAGINGNGIGQFDSPAGIVVDSMNNIYVVDSFNNRIQVFSQSE